MNYANSDSVVLVCFCGKAGTIFGSLYSTVGEGICRTNAYNFRRCCSRTSGIGTGATFRSNLLGALMGFSLKLTLQSVDFFMGIDSGMCDVWGALGFVY